MGCDIHMRLETQQQDGSWKPCEMYSRNDNGQYKVVEVYGSRHYSLFAALCGVRDYSPGTPKISDPKGMPEDASSETTAYLVEYWGSDGHSHSWNTLKELYDFAEKNKVIKHSGLITPTQAKDLDEAGTLPTMWCQGSSDKTMVYHEWEEQCDILSELIEAIESQIKKITWWFTPSEHAEQIRIIYCFDN